MTICRGSCCEEFVLPMSKEMLYRRLQNGEATNGSVRESQLLYDMVVSLRRGTPIIKPSGRYFPYTCRFWDRESRKCTIYSRRPVVCRIYPSGKRCKDSLIDPEKGCDLSEGTDIVTAQQEFNTAWGIR